jgi:6-pyruvoyltetrahydropterin/6-carboxytetrahydropterin synthase
VLDHSQFEKDIPWFEGKQPSTENLVVFIWDVITKHLKGCSLHRIRLVETPTIYTDYYGDSNE